MTGLWNRFLRICSTLAVVWLCQALPTRGQQTSVFFRVVSPTNTVITAFGGGTVFWSNAITEGVTCTVQRALAVPGPSNWTDYVHHAVTNVAMELLLYDPNPPAGMVLIPGGVNVGTDPDFGAYSLTVDAFYMDRYEVTKALWDEVYAWAVTNGYSFDNAGSGKAPEHPVQTVNWYDCVKWCNARSEIEGKVPVYYIDAAFAVVYRAGPEYSESILTPFVNGTADGYRLPTDSQWQYAARGGQLGRRYPWGDGIDHEKANYQGETRYTEGGYPYTSPTGAFSAGDNVYGLSDMTGNVIEWCDGWYIEGRLRMLHGGGWAFPPDFCRIAGRFATAPDYASDVTGFRTVLLSGR